MNQDQEQENPDVEQALVRFDYRASARQQSVQSLPVSLCCAEGTPIRKNLERTITYADEPLMRRLTALSTIGELKLYRSIPVLIEVLADPNASVVDGSVRALVAMTRQEFGKDVRKWRDWWETKGKKRLAVLHRGVLKVAWEFGWRLEAWAIFSNHYHFVAQSPELEDDAKSLRRMLSSLHEKTAKWVNRLDRMPGRQVWFNFRETTLTYEKSYLARLNYTHQNAVKHGLVPVSNQYPWCSARWFERTARPAQITTIYRLKIDRLNLPDDFEVSPDW